MAIAAGVKVDTPQDAVPQLVSGRSRVVRRLLLCSHRARRAGAGGSHVDRGRQHLYRNIWKPFIHPQMSPREESLLAKLASLVVKIRALAVIFFCRRGSRLTCNCWAESGWCRYSRCDSSACTPGGSAVGRC